jgi:hypothetical protein
VLRSVGLEPIKVRQADEIPFHRATSAISFRRAKVVAEPPQAVSERLVVLEVVLRPQSAGAAGCQQLYWGYTERRG